MKYILFLITSLFLTTTLFAQNTQLRNTIIFPVEVFGKNGTTESVFLNINDAANMSSIAGLRIKVHGLTYTNKASIKINSSTWKDLNNSNVVYLHENELGMQGMGTTYWASTASTINILVPFSAATFSTTNTVTFRFNDLNGLTVGYRVLDIGVIKSNYADLTLHTKKIQDDPSKWKPYSTDPARILNGSNQWYNAVITHNGEAIKARCNDCHVEEGYDLKYFNYSNKSIVLRSTALHNLTLQNAQDIASFIRTRDVPYETNGRPWNPVYQPGPGLDSKPVRSWAAGAGLEWVLTNHWDTITNIFPYGISNRIVNYGTNGLRTLNTALYTLNQREIPLPMQFPDWNRWLPHVHPKDAFPLITNEINDLQNTYINSRNLFLSPNFNKSLNGSTTLSRVSQPFFESLARYYRSSYSGPTTYTNYYQSKAQTEYAFKLISVMKWRAVKIFEIIHEFDVEDVGDQELNYPIGDIGQSTWFPAPPGPWSDKRRWFDATLFKIGPHVTSVEPFLTELYPQGMTPYSQWTVESACWYVASLVVNSGNRGVFDQYSFDQGYLARFSEYCFARGSPGESWTPYDISSHGIWTVVFLKLLEGTDRGFPSQSSGGYQVITVWNTLEDIASLRPDSTGIGSFFKTSAERRRYSDLLNVLTQALCDSMNRYSAQYFKDSIWRSAYDGGWPFITTNDTRTYYYFMNRLINDFNFINGAYNGDINISQTTFDKLIALKRKLYPTMP